MLVIIKKKQAPNNAPEILVNIDDMKYLDPRPITTTLPQVNNVVPWNPITKSVITKLIISAGRYLMPISAGI